MDEKRRKQLERITRGLDIKSKLEINGIDKMMKTVKIAQNADSLYNTIYNDNFSKVIESASAAADALRPIKMSYIDTLSNMDNIAQAGIAFEYMQRSLIFNFESPLKAWQSSMEQMSRSFTKNYNSIVTDSIKDLALGMKNINYNSLDFNSLKMLGINDYTTEFGGVRESEADYKVENEIDLQEVRAIVHAEIEDVNLITKEQDSNIIVAVNKLTESIETYNAKGGMISEVVKGVLITVVSTWIMFIITSLNPYSTSNADIKHTIKATKQIVRTMDMSIDNNIYNTIRIVAKDELEVRRSNKMKSKTKYRLDSGDLVKIEHKNKNWTKISYTNTDIGEREIGWVLTRYIKRLD